MVRQLSERDADNIVLELRRVQRDGYEVADVRHAGDAWRIYAVDRRFHDAQRGGLFTFRRRATD
jgi:hypothetical protein